MGFVPRNSNGDVVTTRMKRSTFTSEVSYAKTEVTPWGIEVAESIGHNSLIIESDSQELVDLCLNKKDNRK